MFRERHVEVYQESPCSLCLRGFLRGFLMQSTLLLYTNTRRKINLDDERGVWYDRTVREVRQMRRFVV